MSDSKNLPIAGKIFSRISGSITVIVNGNEFSKIRFVDSSMELSLLNDKLSSSLIRVVPKEARKLSFLRRISKILAKLGITVIIKDGKGELMVIGYKVHSVLGDVKIKVLRLRKYLK
ncbi:MAG: hypothetical protein M1327_04145 [Candidatus Thermoplasmatota archaeon]|nr:hypothetical protein [Candidatus Thermoplasmatota archaeon]